VALFLYIVGSFVVGFIAGWLVRGWTSTRAATSTVASTPPPAITSSSAASPAEAEPVAAAETLEPEAPAEAAEVAAEPASTATDEPVVIVAEAVEEIVVVEETADGTLLVEPVAEVTETLVVFAEPEPVAEADPVAEIAEPVVAEPSTDLPVAEPLATAAAADDLIRIDGIGPKMAGALHKAGITTFEQLAATDETTLRAAISAAGMRFSPTLVTWPAQARALAAGTGSLVSGNAN
jgi:predicted flap endonuclease-1-like 5' DNA nuclease